MSRFISRIKNINSDDFMFGMLYSGIVGGIVGSMTPIYLKKFDEHKFDSWYDPPLISMIGACGGFAVGSMGFLTSPFWIPATVVYIAKTKYDDY